MIGTNVNKRSKLERAFASLKRPMIIIEIADCPWINAVSSTSSPPSCHPSPTMVLAKT
jgi:hypothetical protein